MGDVALLSPVVYGMCLENPEHTFYIVSRPVFKDLFPRMDNLYFIGADLKGINAGLSGLWKLCRTLENLKPDHVIDVHDNIRTHIISYYLKLKGVQISRFDKGRKEKQKLIVPPPKKIFQLIHTTTRYVMAFEKAGCNKPESLTPVKRLGKVSEKVVQALIHVKNFPVKIGIAPFAAHLSKEWPEERMLESMDRLQEQLPVGFLLFGGGEREVSRLNHIKKTIPNSIVIAGKFSLAEELELMSHLNLMISMDSANMHLASLVGIPVVSVWGPTHPCMGFSPLFNEKGIVQTQQECRPCSIYGKITTKWQLECAQKSMETITVDMLVNKVLEELSR
jgi:ADP-heptose:LPS heptosyltransferase